VNQLGEAFHLNKRDSFESQDIPNALFPADCSPSSAGFFCWVYFKTLGICLYCKIQKRTLVFVQTAAELFYDLYQPEDKEVASTRVNLTQFSFNSAKAAGASHLTPIGGV
jgi:hypothetical protein